MTSSSLGSKLRYFRKVRQVSQLDLETAAGLSFGTVSRIETDLINPTKETLFNIAQKLKLNKFETDYLIGTTAEPVSQSEIQQAVNSVKEYFARPDVFAYLLDDRHRLFYYSKNFPKLLNYKQEDIANLIGRPMPEIMLDRKHKLYNLIEHAPDVINTLTRTLGRYHQEVGFMQDEESYQDSLHAIQNNLLAAKIWKSIVSNSPTNINQQDARKVTFQLGNIPLTMNFASENLFENQRFIMVEYIPSQESINIINQLLSQ